ncbi:MAG: RNA-dependent DNA polymerase, partial [Clostridiales bacterium]|nr:RNA-dependent DNA polymerase [Clostridiales bacterium]
MSKILQQSLFDKITNEENLYKAYKKSLEGDSKYNPDAMTFAQDEVYSLMKLRQSLIDETYKFDGYIRFPVFEPKKRIIDAPHYKDKIVQLAINNVLKEVYNKCFIFDSYACIDGKGTHKCVDKIQHLMRKAKWEYGEETM